MEYDILNNEFTNYGTSYLSENEWGNSVYFTQYDDTTLYVLNGYSDCTINVYDLRTLSDHKLNTTVPIVTQRRACMASSHSPTPRLYITGGGGDAFSLQILDIDDLLWLEDLPQMNRGHEYHGCIVVNDRLWTIGGGNNGVERININDLDVWTYIGNLDCSLLIFGLTEVNCLIYVIGGSCDGTDAHFHVIDTATDSIEIRSESFLFGRHSAPMIAVDGIIYGFGGTSVSQSASLDTWITLDLLRALCLRLLSEQRTSHAFTVKVIEKLSNQSRS